MKHQPLLLFLLALGAATTASHAATTIQVRVQTLGPVGVAPVVVGFSDASFDILDLGPAASGARWDPAETGGSRAPQCGALLGPGIGPGSPPVFGPGGAFVSTTFRVDDGSGMPHIASMILPSNDWFVGHAGAIDASSLLAGSSPEVRVGELL